MVFMKVVSSEKWGGGGGSTGSLGMAIKTVDEIEIIEPSSRLGGRDPKSVR